MSQLQCCDECGRERIKVHRRYNGTGYCSNCYARVFKRVQCPKCSRDARLPNNILGAICRQCIATRPCIRCGESSKPLGLINKYGTVCASCAPYFKKEEACEVCGRLSQRLTRVTRFNDDLKRCERCAIIDYGTCLQCRRYRKLIKHQEQKLCALCSEGQMAVCCDCGNHMPLARGKRCEDCYWLKLFSKRSLINRELMTDEYYRASFNQFASWLCVSVGAHKASITIAKYTEFFRQVERKWPSFPSHKALLINFGLDYLRRYRKVVSWLVAELYIELDEDAKKTIAEEQRIERILARVPRGSIAYDLLLRFWKHQKSRCDRGDITLLTARLSLTPAVGFLQVSKFGQPTTQGLAKYLISVPGQRASITKFISYLNTECRISIEMPGPKNTVEAQKRRLEKQLMGLAAKENFDAYFLKWCEVALAYFHDIRLSQAKLKSSCCIISIENDGYFIEYKKERYFIPLLPSQS